MSSDRPVPPSIQPRKGPGGSGAARPSAASPRVVKPAPRAPARAPEPMEPVVAAQPVVPTQPESPARAAASTTTEAPGHSAAPATAPAKQAAAVPATAEPAAPAAAVETESPGDVPTPSVVTTAMLKALRSASSAVTGATAAVSSEFSRITHPPTPAAGSSPRLESTKADPTIAATDTYSAAASRGATPTGTARMPAPSAAREGAPRRVRLSVSRVDPWSVMKLSFLLSVAIGVMIVVAAAVVWFVLDGLAVFTKVNDLITEIAGQESSLDILKYVEFSRIVSGATVVAVVDVVLLTALSTIGAFLYNITAALVGGVNLTLTDD